MRRTKNMGQDLMTKKPGDAVGHGLETLDENSGE
jgi:hypothetical protein